MPISLITGGNLGASAANGANVTITLPTLLQNDVVYVVAGRVGGPTMNTAGYTQIGTVTSSTHVVTAFRKVMGATPDTTVVVNGSANTADAMSVVVYCLRGVDIFTPEDATATTASGSSTNPNCAAITTVTANAWVLASASSRVNDAGVTAPTGYLSIAQTTANDTNPATSAIAYIVEVTPALEDPPAYSGWSSGTWGAITIAVRPAIDSSTTVTGVSGTGQVGSITQFIQTANVDVTGVTGTGQVGTALAVTDVSIPVTGVEATGFTGTVDVTGTANVDLTGVFATGFAGQADVVGTANVDVTGVFGTGEVGDPTIQFSYDVTGVFGTGEVGSVEINLAPNIYPDGVFGTGEVGSVEINLAPNIYLDGVFATGEVGQVNIIGTAVVPTTGVFATGEVGSVEIYQSPNIYPDGVFATGEVGSVTVDLLTPVIVTGVEAYGLISQVEVWLSIVPDQNPAWNGISPSDVPAWSLVSPAQSPLWVSVAPSGDPSYTEINPSQPPNWAPVNTV